VNSDDCYAESMVGCGGGMRLLVGERMPMQPRPVDGYLWERVRPIGRTKQRLLLDAPEPIVMFLQHEVKCLDGSYDVPTVVLSPLQLVAL